MRHADRVPCCGARSSLCITEDSARRLRAGPPGTAPIPRPYPCTDDSCGPVLGTPLSARIDLGLVHARLGKGALPSSLGAAPRVFERLFRPAPHAWWLDSAVTDRGGRWSFMGSGKGGALWRTASYLGDGVLEEGLSGEGGASASTTTHRLPGGFWDWLDEDVQARRLCPAAATAAADLPFDFWGGWVGYIGYELGTELGPGAGLAADVAGNPPHASLVWADRLLALDCATGEVYALACHIQGDGRAADEAQAWVAGMLEAVQAVAGEPDGETTPGAGAAGAPQDPVPSPDPVLDFQPRERHERYLDNIRACLQVEGAVVGMMAGRIVFNRGADFCWVGRKTGAHVCHDRLPLGRLIRARCGLRDSNTISCHTTARPCTTASRTSCA